jgi:enediyne biosynthesis protein E4
MQNEYPFKIYPLLSSLLNRKSNWLCLLLLFLFACKERPVLFRELTPSESGIDFNNIIAETDSLNMFEYANFYTGAGVAAGDFNNDGLDDIFFGGNMVSSRLYLNKGGLKFEDITDKAGLTTHSWINGIALVDINQDGWLDLYLSVSGKPAHAGTRNLLFINNKDLSFTEQAAQYGIDDPGATTQAAFLDYDKDGDLDLFLAQNAVQLDSKVNHLAAVRPEPRDPNTDKLYRNNGDLTFTDISTQAGIVFNGYSLGLVVADVNGDNWDDVFITNDFQGNDLLYINQGDSTFSEEAAKYLRHSSFSGMGADMRDINHDCIPDILVLDMLAEGNARQKLLMDWPTYDRHMMSVQNGYLPQYTRNTLQISNGKDYSEIGQFSGIENTDWSWSPLFGDFDNDKDQDILITNGFVRDLGDKDFVDYINPYAHFRSPKKNEVLKMIAQKEGAALENFLFENNGNLTFTKKSTDWGITKPTFSYGATLSDLDNDGDLELIINNSNSTAQVFENRQEELIKNNFLEIRLKGKAPNHQGLGAKIWLYSQQDNQYYQNYPVRGYLSSLSEVVHFGLAHSTVIDSIRVQWPNGLEEVRFNIAANQRLDFEEGDAKPPVKLNKQKKPLLLVRNENTGLDFVHKERPSIDFRNQPLIPHMHSVNGPGLSAGDVDGDGLDDLFIGGDVGQQGCLYVQQKNKTFRKSDWSENPEYEDMGSLFFDADLDGDLDLIIASGGTSYPVGSEYYADRLYLNNGKGNFSKEIILGGSSSSSVVAGADFDKDGDIDVFIGGRVVPGDYPQTPKSKLYLNNASSDKSVQLQDVADQVAGLEFAGMVTSAIWSDFDNDSWVDLILVGEWMPLMIFKNNQGVLKKIESASLIHSTGWWNSITGADFDRDGDIDYVAGNLGLNSRFTCSTSEPIELYAKDFDNNGKIDPILCMYIDGQQHAPYFRSQLMAQIPALKKRFNTFAKYSKAAFSDIFSKEDLQGAFVLRSETFASSYFENKGNGMFTIMPLPLSFQISPTNGIIAADIDNDGNLDILSVGNSYANDGFVGKDDAGTGACLLGDGKGNFRMASNLETGFRADMDAKAMNTLLVGKEELLVISNNNGPLESFSFNQDLSLRLERLQPLDAYALITLRSGSQYKQEFYYGGSYLAQSSRYLKMNPQMEKVEIVQFNGAKRKI